ncbi:hypothetical protein F5887DRAFT_1164039 [Amanita rubescens]|nr:hypothetical protein F5887DRAFT_1164039 [Amanita rubescens]
MCCGEALSLVDREKSANNATPTSHGFIQYPDKDGRSTGAFAGALLVLGVAFVSVKEYNAKKRKAELYEHRTCLALYETYILGATLVGATLFDFLELSIPSGSAAAVSDGSRREQAESDHSLRIAKPSAPNLAHTIEQVPPPQGGKDGDPMNAYTDASDYGDNVLDSMIAAVYCCPINNHRPLPTLQCSPNLSICAFRVIFARWKAALNPQGILKLQGFARPGPSFISLVNVGIGSTAEAEEDDSRRPLVRLDTCCAQEEEPEETEKQMEMED